MRCPKEVTIARFLIELDKDAAYSGAPAQTASVGYMNPIYSKPEKNKKKSKKLGQTNIYLM